ncbi:MAG: sigma-70 family RNA polymerase sigma factor [Acidimicrobiales bacterium]
MARNSTTVPSPSPRHPAPATCRSACSIPDRPTPARVTDPVAAGAAVLAYRNGDRQALGSLMTWFTPMMTGVARRYLRTPQDVEDAVQDAWVAFTRAAATIATPMAIGGWLCTTTARAALAIAQRQARCRPSDRPVEGRVAPIDSAVMESYDERDAVREAVGRLSPEDREMVRFLFDAELPYTEIAARTGRAIGGIGPTRQRIITKLRHDRAIHRQYLARTA